MIFQLILPVLLTPNNYCFQDLVTPHSDSLWLVNQAITKLDMVYSDFVWSPPDMVSVLILDSQKYGDNRLTSTWSIGFQSSTFQSLTFFSSWDTMLVFGHTKRIKKK